MSQTPSSRFDRGLVRSVLVAAGAAVALACLVHLVRAVDYVGIDNDDAMRLVQVRDYLAGQGWFDLVQRRLGLSPGVLMHWSRLVDAPIALLIQAFDPLVGRERAEALALGVWPLALMVPVLVAFGHAAKATGGIAASHVSLLLTGLYLATSNRFWPGSIDHHNVQIALVAILVAVLVARPGRRGYALAGVAAAAALAVGAETTPLVAVVCGLVALEWAMEGRAFSAHATVFSLALALGSTFLFLATVPPERYGIVTCDALSLGFLVPVAVGGVLLALASALAGGRGRVVRFACLAAVGAATGASALAVAPQCLGSPLAGLDPMLIAFWLDFVSEARSLPAVARTEPEALGAFYAPGLFALGACVLALARRDRVRLHATMGLLLLAALGIAFVQVRGAMYSNLLSILPLSWLLADLRLRYRTAGGRLVPALVYGLACLSAVPAVWGAAGAAAAGAFAAMRNPAPAASPQPAVRAACYDAAGLAPLAALAPTTVVADVDAGAWILRFTGHRVLSAPYHRNQAGMLAELRIALAAPAEAEARVRGAGVGVIAVCVAGPQATPVAGAYAGGLFARLAAGDVPGWLEPLPSATPLRLFVVRPAG